MQSYLARVEPDRQNAARVMSVSSERRILLFDLRKIEPVDEPPHFTRWMRTFEDQLWTTPYAVELIAVVNLESGLRIPTNPTANRPRTVLGLQTHIT